MTSALRLAAMRAIVMFHNCEGQSFKTVSTDHNFWRERRAEADLNRGPSAYEPNALPLGQTGSHVSSDVICFLYSACMRQHKTCHFSFFFTTVRMNWGGRVVRSSAGKLRNTGLWVQIQTLGSPFCSDILIYGQCFQATLLWLSVYLYQLVNYVLHPANQYGYIRVMKKRWKRRWRREKRKRRKRLKKKEEKEEEEEVNR